MSELADDLARIVSLALAEDVGSGDVTARLVPEDRRTRATVVSRERAVICGAAWFEAVFEQLSNEVTIAWQVQEGQRVDPGQTVCTLTGPARALLTGERTALNFLQTLSGTATTARDYADAVLGTRTQILDTRKTLPGLRMAQKYATRCGGCRNHRMGLYDAVLIKENHIEAAGSVPAAVASARAQAPDLTLEIEVEGLAELREALEAGADIVLLDNFTPEQLREAVALNAGRAKLEVSGGITLDEVRAIAETGVDYISVGALTKNVTAVDLSMRFEGREA